MDVNLLAQFLPITPRLVASVSAASGKATTGMSWIIITHPDLANITFLSAPTAVCTNTGDWNVGGGTPGDINPPTPRHL